MVKPAELSFELLHLISAISNRIEMAYQKCNLDAAQIYTLVYIQSYGKKYKRQGKDVTIVLRDRFTNILKQTFKCSNDQTAKLLRELREQELTDDEFSIGKSAMKVLFGTSQGRTRVISLTSNGAKKIKEFGDELRRLHRDLTKEKSKLLCPPGTDKPGPLGEGIVLFLSIRDTFAEPEQHLS